MDTGTVFNNNTQAAHFPDDVKKVVVRVVGKDRILPPVANSWGSFFLHGTTVTDDFMRERATQKQQER